MSPTNTADAGIPVINISTPSPEVAQKVLDAASTHGFLFIENDGLTIPPEDINAMFDLSRKYFAKFQHEKSEFAIHSEKAGGLNRGWVRMQGESLDPDGQKQGDPKEAFNIAPPHPDLQPLPSPFSDSTSTILTFQRNCHSLCTQILQLLNSALQIPSQTYLSARHDQTRGPSGSIFRLLYYPKTSTLDGHSIRAGAHSDYGSLTLLFRLPGQAGLEVLTPSGLFAPVPVNPFPERLANSPILVNIGDLLSFWTNGMLKSTVHRVTFGGGEERYSIAYFCHPLDEVRLDAVPSRAIEDYGDKGLGREELEGQRRKIGLGVDEEIVLTAREHLDRRLKVTYGL
ncbi:hypothetical protein B0J11DRAFT_34258 [Dendryphion nanum]|uniref:Fe2OG dioxygenase domain-containing protein n=1 Tax=Dendryphion nanum TaxID=256645 RepID=A0A9P9EL33_9PLEO|nr:hypothetical protein B0J11DRAFT_34258 [Dendryphion nanum]